ncbi:MAG TPA: type II toxin-antitoxin system death-on-curing family toxin [Candidatus Acidoferrales bacterium]|nr:type II toxin-antitoxin system death-on-curing family toxin [Candidatus Acidoferrales bacterium]
MSRIVLDAIHFEQLREHGGLHGIRDEGALESALARPRQKWWYDRKTDIASLGAAYGFGIVRNHPYRDGNKRVGFLALITFLGLNGHEFEAADEDVVSEMFALAAGRVSESELARWIDAHTVRSE